MTAKDQKEHNALPIGLVGPNVRMRRTVEQGQLVTYDDVEFAESNFIMYLRELMQMGD